MSSLHTKVYGSAGKVHSAMRTLGSYNKAPMKKLGSYNSPVKRLGVYNGITTGKSNIHQEIYPKY